ncbi:MAG: DUF2946 domain-containing protein [Desulfuromonas sp.]|jgi:hypothetical protein|nr:DUF2946 domain-containing protein [Desulfuromonas sp.]
MPLSHSQRVRYCSRLGLLAMLLLLVGPLLGQGLSLRDEQACSGEHAKSSSASHEMDWAKCGYCQLLLNSPVVPSSRSQARPCLTSSILGVQPALPVTGRDTVFIGALTRAPPIS